jgi:hypothetical protein
MLVLLCLNDNFFLPNVIKNPLAWSVTYWHFYHLCFYIVLTYLPGTRETLQILPQEFVSCNIDFKICLLKKSCSNDWLNCKTPKFHMVFISTNGLRRAMMAEPKEMGLSWGEATKGAIKEEMEGRTDL